jgi:hypothetical protein
MNVQEAGSLHSWYFCECRYEQFCFKGLGWLLELSTTLATWPSRCRYTHEGLDLSNTLIFDETCWGQETCTFW